MRSIRFIAIVLAVLVGFTSCSRDPNVVKKRYLESGNKYFEKGRYKEASIQYRNALKRDPKYGPAYYKLALVGMDVPSTDPYLIDHPKVFRNPEQYPIILELMTNLDKIVGKEVYLMALPMHLKDGDGSWVRAVAFVPKT